MKNDILVRLRLAAEDFSRGVKAGFAEVEAEAEKAGGQASEGFARGFDARKAALIGAVGAAGVAAIQAVKQSLELARDLDVASQQIGVGVEELQKYRFAAAQVGVAADELDGNISKLTLTIGEANAGNRRAQEAFVDLGVGFSTTTGQARETGTVLQDVAARLLEVESPSERARLGTQLLGEEFNRLLPLLPEIASGMAGTTAELDQFGGVLSREEIQNLQATNAKIEQMKMVLSIRVASIVAENADAVDLLTSALAGMAQVANVAAGSLRDLYAEYRGYQAITKESGRASAFFSDIEDVRQAGYNTMAWENPANGVRGMQTTGMSVFNRMMFGTAFPGSSPPRGSDIAPPVVDPKPAPLRGGGRPNVGGGALRKSDEQREAERAAKEAIRNEQQLEEAIRRTLEAQSDTTRVAAIRAEQGDVAAARAEAELAFLRQHPLAVHDTVEELATALGLTKELTDEDRKRLQLLIDQGDAAQEGTGKAAAAKAQAEADREAARRAEQAEREAERQAEAWRRAHEQAVMDVADLWEDLFTGGVDRVWDRFKGEGLRIIAEIAGQFTLAMLAGQGGSFNLQGAFAAAMGRSPLGSIFGGIGGYGPAANDNGFLGGLFGSGGAVAGAMPSGAGLGGNGFAGLGMAGLRVAGIAPSGAAGGSAATSLLMQTGPALGFAALGAGIGGLVGGGKAGQLGGAAGAAAIGMALGGPVGAIAGAVLGGLLGGSLSSTKRGSAIVGGGADGRLGVTGFYGNSSSRKDAASGSATSLIDSIYQIAEALGADVDASKGRVSIGVRKDQWFVDPQGRGYTKASKYSDIRGFGQDEGAAREFAIGNLLADGILSNISQAAQNVLSKNTGDLEAAIEKALLIESVPKLLKERLDPLGAALDTLYDKFKDLADALREGGASAEQIAQARQLWELEKADAIASIGAASKELKDYLASLTAGSNSPLSVRQQMAEAEARLAPLEAQVQAAQAARDEVERLKAGGGTAAQIAAAEEAARVAAGKIDQGGITETSQLLLSLSRQANASTGEFFGDFDRIRALLGQGIALVDGAVPQAGARDPFTELTAQNTGEIAMILPEHTRLLNAINDNLSRFGAVAGFGDWMHANRAFAAN